MLEEDARKKEMYLVYVFLLAVAGVAAVDTTIFPAFDRFFALPPSVVSWCDLVKEATGIGRCKAVSLVVGR